MRIFVLTCLIGVFLSNCSQTDFSEEIKRIDTMNARLEHVEKRLIGIDTSNYPTAWENYKNKTGFIEKWHMSRGDTIGPDLAMFLSEYKLLKKPYKNIPLSYRKALSELEYSRLQLNTLRHDLENNKLDSQAVNKFMIDESQAVDNLISQIEQLRSGDSVTVIRSAQLEPKMDSIITALKSSE